jgi:hypothetical protein
MKTITKFSVLVVAIVASISMSYAALTKIDFETKEGGSEYFWAVFQNGPAATDVYENMTVPFANPSATGINTSAKCAKFIADPTAAPWAGCFTDDLGSFTLTDQNCKVKVMVNKNVISNFGVKFEGDAGNVEILVANTKTNEWEELTFDFSGKIGVTYKRLVLLPEFPSARTAGSLTYFDNISFNPAGTIVQIPVPTVAAPTPTTAATNVVSIFSNAYTNVPVSSFRTDWSSGTMTDLQIAGNDTKKYSDLGFVGIETTGTLVDATAMSYIHFDVWTPNMNELKFKLVDFGANGVWEQGGDNVEHELIFTPTKEVWNSYHVALSNFTGLTTKAHIAQYIISGAPLSIAYIDNIYFSKVASALSNNISTSTKCFPSQVANKLIVTSESEINSVVISSLLGQSVKIVTVNGLEKSMDVSNLSAGNYIVTVNLQSGAVSTHKIVKL